MSRKQAWPELVGQSVDEAVAIIQSENPNLHVVKLHQNSPTTRDMRRERVRVFHDDNEIVTSEPHVG